MANVKLWVIVGVIAAVGMAVTIITVPLILTRSGTTSPSHSSTLSFGMFVLMCLTRKDSFGSCTLGHDVEHLYQLVHLENDCGQS